LVADDAFLDNRTVFGVSDTENRVPLKINLTVKSHMASTTGTSDSDGDSMPVKTDKVRENKPAVTLSKPKIIRDEFGWPLMTDEAGNEL